MENSSDPIVAAEALEDLEWEDNPYNIPFVYHMIAGESGAANWTA
jgi:hypothetical protein